MSQNLPPRNNIRSRTGEALTAVVYRDKPDVHKMTNMHHLPANGNFCDKHGNYIEPKIIQNYKTYMGYVD
jgi:hypothetical protein